MNYREYFDRNTALERKAAKKSKKAQKRAKKLKGVKAAFAKTAPISADFVTTDAFLTLFEWRKLRMQVLKKYGASCQCCGATPDDGVKINVDHIKPRRKYPHLALAESNLQVLCEVCNHGKGNWDETDWRPSDGFQYDPLVGLPEVLRSF